MNVLTRDLLTRRLEDARGGLEVTERRIRDDLYELNAAIERRRVYRDELAAIESDLEADVLAEAAR